MSFSSTVNLEKLVLRFPHAKLRGTAIAQICVSPDTHTERYEDLAALQNVWVRKGRNLRLELSCLVDGHALDHSIRLEIETALLDAKVRHLIGF